MNMVKNRKIFARTDQIKTASRNMITIKFPFYWCLLTILIIVPYLGKAQNLKINQIQVNTGLNATFFAFAPLPENFTPNLDISSFFTFKPRKEKSGHWGIGINYLNKGTKGGAIAIEDSITYRLSGRSHYHSFSIGGFYHYSWPSVPKLVVNVGLYVDRLFYFRFRVREVLEGGNYPYKSYSIPVASFEEPFTSRLKCMFFYEISDRISVNLNLSSEFIKIFEKRIYYIPRLSNYSFGLGLSYRLIQS